LAVIADIARTSPDLVLVDIDSNDTCNGFLIGEYLIDNTMIPFICLARHHLLKAPDRRQTLLVACLLMPFSVSDLKVAIEKTTRLD
jgi:hypothetical protein